MKNAKLVCLCCLSLVVLLTPSLFAAVQKVGAVLAVQEQEVAGKKRFVFSIENAGAAQITVYAPDLARVRWHWDGIWEKDDIAIAKTLADWPSEFVVSSTDFDDRYIIETAELVIEVIKRPFFEVNFLDKSQAYYLSEGEGIEYNKDYQPLGDGSYNYDNFRYGSELPRGFKLKETRRSPQGEIYFGLGENPTRLNRRGKDIQMWNFDSYGWQETSAPLYMSLPFYYGVQGPAQDHPAFCYGLFFNNPARPTFKMATEDPDQYSFEAGDGQIDYFFFGGGGQHQITEVLARYSELTGRPPMLPKWAFGYQMSRWSYENQDWIEWLVDEFQRQAIPLDVIYIDIDYFNQANVYDYQSETLHQLTFNHTRFPNPAAMIEHATQSGVKLVPMIEAYLTTADPLYTEANNLKHLIKTNNGSSKITPTYFGDVAWLDFTSSSARNWWQTKLTNFLDLYPFDGLWNDLNEPGDAWDMAKNQEIPLSAMYSMDNRFGNNTDSRNWQQNVRDTYALFETSLSYQALLAQYPNQRPMVLSRSGWPGIQRYAMNWSGDNRATWDHCRHNIRLGLSVMISGQPFIGHDVGGFAPECYETGCPQDPSDELMTRWTEWAAFTPLIRNHSQHAQKEREPFRYDAIYANAMIDSIKLRYRLMPYFYSLTHLTSQTGLPMNAPTFFYFMADGNTYLSETENGDSYNEYDFMVGKDMLVSPIYTEGATTRSTYLPAGTDWYSWLTDKVLPGGKWHEESAPLDKLPVYVRAGAIVPLGPDALSMQDSTITQPEWLEINVWPGPNNSFTLYEDDGLSLDYLQGVYSTTVIETTLVKGQPDLTIQPPQGSYETGRSFYFVKFHAVPKAAFARLNDTLLTNYSSLDELKKQPQGFSYDNQAAILTVKIQDTKASLHLALEAYIPPQISSVPSSAATPGQPYLYDEDGRAEASGTTPLTWSVTQPTGMTIDPQTGLISWIPEQKSGTVTAEILVTNPGGQDRQSWKITVKPQQPCGVIAGSDAPGREKSGKFWFCWAIFVVGWIWKFRGGNLSAN